MRILVTGCSGGGKTTLIDALANRGYATVAEPGRRIIAEERAGAGAALPWVDSAAFSDRAYNMALADLTAVQGEPVVFFDRGLLEPVVAMGADPATALDPFPYDTPVFIAPPWPEIYVNDDDRKHGLADAMVEYHRLCAALETRGIRSVALPKVSVGERVEFVLRTLGMT